MRSTLRRREPTTAWDGWTTLADPESRDVKRARRDQMLSGIVYGVRSAVNDATFRDSKDFNAVQQTIMTLSRACETALRQLENLGRDDETQ